MMNDNSLMVMTYMRVITMINLLICCYDNDDSDDEDDDSDYNDKKFVVDYDDKLFSRWWLMWRRAEFGAENYR